MLINPNAKMTVEDIHGMSCLIIDDAFLEPNKLRLYAKESQRPECIRKSTLGYAIHPADLRDQMPNYENELAGLIHRHIGKNICDFFGLKVSDVTLKAFKGPYFNCVGVKKLSANAPHVDLGHVSTFAYLNLDHQCAGGTRIYRHIPSNTLNIVQHRETSLAGMMKLPLEFPLVESTEEWEMVKFFKMKFNRLIAFNSSAIHKIDLTDGKFSMNINSTRLCLNTFFNYIDANGTIASRKSK